MYCFSVLDEKLRKRNLKPTALNKSWNNLKSLIYVFVAINIQIKYPHYKLTNFSLSTTE